MNIGSSLSCCINVVRTLTRPLHLYALLAVAPAVIATPYHGSGPITASAKVSVADLDLATEAGVNAARERLAAAAKRLCRTFSNSTRISDQITISDCYDETFADSIRRFAEQLATIKAEKNVVARNATIP